MSLKGMKDCIVWLKIKFKSVFPQILLYIEVREGYLFFATPG